MNQHTEPNDSVLQNYQRFLHHSVAMIGGFLGAYAILVRSNFFGNAQTANLIYIIFAIFGRDFWSFLCRVGIFVLYFGSGVVYVLIQNKTSWNTQKIALWLDAIMIVILGFLPSDMDSMLALYPIFICMSFQWNAFSGVYGYASSTIFSSNSVRQVSLAIGEYLCNKDKKHLHKAFFFIGSLIGFHLGVASGYLAVIHLGLRAVWMGLFHVALSACILKKCSS